MMRSSRPGFIGTSLTYGASLPTDAHHKNKKRLMTLPVNEFLRRFLLHVLPPGFVSHQALRADGASSAGHIAPAMPETAGGVRSEAPP
jgi:hypothetical protein